MDYCPFCAQPVQADKKICPHCRNSLDLSIIQDQFIPGETTRQQSRATFKIWLRQNALVLWPIVLFLIGFVLGSLIIHGYSTIKFGHERMAYENRIREIEQNTRENTSEAMGIRDELESTLENKDDQIAVLLEQQNNLAAIINFTRRLAENSTISASSDEQIDSYRRNVRYLIRQFESNRERLSSLGLDAGRSYNLQTVPQFLQ